MNDISSHFSMVIRGMLPGSPIQRAGAQVGDRVLSLNGAPIPDATAFVNATEHRGTVFQLEVLRGSQVVVLTVDTTIPAVPPGTTPEEVISLFEGLNDAAEMTS